MTAREINGSLRPSIHYTDDADPPAPQAVFSSDSSVLGSATQDGTTEPNVASLDEYLGSDLPPAFAVAVQGVAWSREGDSDAGMPFGDDTAMVRAHIAVNGCFRGFDQCREPGCLVHTEYVVAPGSCNER